MVLIPGTGTERVKKEISKAVEVKTLEDSVKQALLLAKAGDKIVFSPGFTSFGMFKNEFDRGDKFNEIVAKI